MHIMLCIFITRKLVWSLNEAVLLNFRKGKRRAVAGRMDSNARTTSDAI
jgi:hypothetical protein